MCEAAISGTLQTPVLDVGEIPPIGFEDLYASFMVTAMGARVEFPAIVKDGKSWGWMDFE
jgi:hypothetical protein